MRANSGSRSEETPLGTVKDARVSISGADIAMHDAYGWAVTNEIPLVVVDAMRVGPISGITGAPGQGEFYVARYCTHGGNFETIVLSPCSVQEAFWLTIDAFNLAERFRTPVTILTDQVVSDMKIKQRRAPFPSPSRGVRWPPRP